MVLFTFMTKLGSLIPLLVLTYQFHWSFFFFFGVLTAFLPSLCKANYTSTMQITQRIIYLSSVMSYTCQLVLNCPVFFTVFALCVWAKLSLLLHFTVSFTTLQIRANIYINISLFSGLDIIS